MRKACPSPLRSNFLVAAALVVLASACAGTSIYDSLTVAPAEYTVWNDAMPGSKPQCNAVLRLSLKNTGEQAITLRDPEAVIVDAPTLTPLRRYPAMVTVDDRRVREVTIEPGRTVEVAFRSPSYGLEPIDLQLHPRVRIALRMQSDLDLPLLFRSPIIDIFETQ
ncbi:MAG: hypothetical protein JXA28_14720 [Bacteroidetes bacterium]|nr:hypothetical protein [Bacteroidota bacterium]